MLTVVFGFGILFTPTPPGPTTQNKKSSRPLHYPWPFWNSFKSVLVHIWFPQDLPMKTTAGRTMNIDRGFLLSAARSINCALCVIYGCFTLGRPLLWLFIHFCLPNTNENTLLVESLLFKSGKTNDTETYANSFWLLPFDLNIHNLSRCSLPKEMSVLSLLFCLLAF